MPKSTTYDHSLWKTRDPVRSPIDKLESARLVVGSVTTSESLVFVLACSSRTPDQLVQVIAYNLRLPYFIRRTCIEVALPFPMA
ncbi:hypothetical protein F4782DRAFT_242028 [Xylaria castorea]|nr:hypothetical protein F4782DRAFT_242028 [Xylaria castorea]